jgi:hypothetical protein
MKKIIILILSAFFLYGTAVAQPNVVENPRAVFYHLNTKQVLALTIWAESNKKSSIEGRWMIGSVPLEIREWRHWSVKSICLHPKWFSCYNDWDKGYPLVEKVARDFKGSLKKYQSLKESYLIVDMLLSGALPIHPVIDKYGIRNFAKVNCHNKWINNMEVIAIVDGHKFMIPRVVRRDTMSL